MVEDTGAPRALGGLGARASRRTHLLLFHVRETTREVRIQENILGGIFAVRSPSPAQPRRAPSDGPPKPSKKRERGKPTPFDAPEELRPDSKEGSKSGRKRARWRGRGFPLFPLFCSAGWRAGRPCPVAACSAVLGSRGGSCRRALGAGLLVSAWSVLVRARLALGSLLVLAVVSPLSVLLAAALLGLAAGAGPVRVLRVGLRFCRSVPGRPPARWLVPGPGLAARFALGSRRFGLVIPP